MRVEQKAPVQLQNLNLQSRISIPAGIGGSHSSILQNSSCCNSIKKWFGNLVTSISHGFQMVGQFFENLVNRICCCCQERDRQPPIARIPLDQALERQNQTLGMLLNRGEIERRFHRIQVAPDIQDGVVPQERVDEGGIDGLFVNQGPFQHLQFAQAPRFKAAVILMLDDQCVGFHQARVNMDELENRFQGETAHILEQAIMQRAQNDTLRGRIMRTLLVMVIDREDGRFDGGALHDYYNANLGGYGGGRGAWPEGLTPAQLAVRFSNILPGDQNTAARNQLTAFFQARDNNPQQ